MEKNLVFFGSSPFSVPVLQLLIDSHFSPAAVVTFPDKPSGRHLKLTPNPVGILAQQHHIKIVTDLYALNLTPYTSIIGLVAAYGKIIPPDILDTFNGQIYNIHPSLLPKYRGPSPLQQQILDGLTDTGVTVIQLDAKMDHGPVVAQKPDRLLPDDTAQTLGDRLFSLGADLFIHRVLLTPHSLPLTPQDHSLATYTHLLTRDSGFIPWEVFSHLVEHWRNRRTANTPDCVCEKVSGMLRAFTPWPGVWTSNPAGKRVKLLSLNPEISVREENSPSRRISTISEIWDPASP